MQILNEIPLSVKLFLNEYPKKRDTYTIYAQLLLHRKKSVVSLRTTTKIDDWDFETQRLKPTKKFNLVCNNLIREKTEKLVNIYLQLRDSQEEVTPRQIVEHFKGKKKKVKERITLLGYFSSFIDGLTNLPNYSDGTIKNYNKTITHLTKFLKASSQSNIALDELNRKFIIQFEKWMHSTPNKKGKRIGLNTSKTYIKKLKAVINSAIANEILATNPFAGFKITAFKTAKKIVLTLSEVEIIRHHDLGGNEMLQRYRDCFIFCVFSGLRFSDAGDLRDESVRYDVSDQLYWLSINMRKTDSSLDVPLLDPAVEIYNRYEEYRKLTGFVLPMPSNQKANTYLKVIMHLCGITKRVTTHTARHSYATIALDLGVPIKIVSELLGHSTVAMTEIYTNILRSKKAETIRNLNKKLKPMNRQESIYYIIDIRSTPTQFLTDNNTFSEDISKARLLDFTEGNEIIDGFTYMDNLGITNGSEFAPALIHMRNFPNK